MLKQKIEGTELVRYNANARGNSTPDCVARGLSLAFNIDYDEILKELRKEAKAHNWSSYKIFPCISQVVKNHAPNDKYIDCTTIITDPDTGEILEGTEDQRLLDNFVDNHPSGTFVILCGKRPDGRKEHLVTAIDGKLYDSWDSRDHYVQGYWHITNVTHEFNLDLATDGETIKDEAIRDIDLYGTKYCIKYGIDVEELRFTGARWKDNILAFGIMWKSSKTQKQYDFSFKLSYNIKMTLEEALKYTSSTIKTRLYDRFYTAVKQDKELEEANKFFEESGESKSDVWLWGAREEKFFHSLPAKVRPFITSLNIEKPGEYSNSVDVCMKLLPGDPRKGKIERARFEGYDCPSVRSMIERYLKTFELPRYDYDPYEEY